MSKQDAPIPLQYFPFQLTDIHLYEIHASLQDSQQEKDTDLPLKVLLHRGNEPEDAEEFGLLIDFETTVPVEENKAVKIYIAIEGHFKAIIKVASIKPEIIQHFKSVDAMLLFWPYLRETLQNLATRMALNISPLPIIDTRALAKTEKIPENQKNSD